MLSELFVPFLLFLPFVASAAWCVTEIVLYGKAKKKLSPSLPETAARLRTRKVLLIVSSVIAGFFLLILLALAALFALAIAFM